MSIADQIIGGLVFVRDPGLLPRPVLLELVELSLQDFDVLEVVAELVGRDERFLEFQQTPTIKYENKMAERTLSLIQNMTSSHCRRNWTSTSACCSFSPLSASLDRSSSQ